MLNFSKQSTCLCVYEYVCVCMCIRVRLHVCLYTSTYARIQFHSVIVMHLCVRACLPACLRSYVRACTFLFLCPFVYPHVSFSVVACACVISVHAFVWEGCAERVFVCACVRACALIHRHQKQSRSGQCAQDVLRCLRK